MTGLWRRLIGLATTLGLCACAGQWTPVQVGPEMADHARIRVGTVDGVVEVHDPVIVGLDLGAVAGIATATPDSLWPPNHKYVSVEVTAVDAWGEPLTVEIVEVVSSEADSGLDPDDVPIDIVITGPATVDLRAERFALDGRTYTITALVTSSSGQVQLLTTTVACEARTSSPGQQLPSKWITVTFDEIPIMEAVETVQEKIGVTVVVEIERTGVELR